MVEDMDGGGHMFKLNNSLETLKQIVSDLGKKAGFTPGTDKMTPEAAAIWLEVNGEDLINDLNNGCGEGAAVTGALADFAVIVCKQNCFKIRVGVCSLGDGSFKPAAVDCGIKLKEQRHVVGKALGI